MDDDVCWSTTISTLVKRGGPGSSTVDSTTHHHGRASDLRARKAQQRSSSSSGGGAQGTEKRGSKSSLLPGGSRDNTMPLLASYGVRLPTMKHDRISWWHLCRSRRYHTSRIASLIPLIVANHRRRIHYLVSVPDRMGAVAKVTAYCLVLRVEALSSLLRILNPTLFRKGERAFFSDSVTTQPTGA